MTFTHTHSSHSWRINLSIWLWLMGVIAESTIHIERDSSLLGWNMYKKQGTHCTESSISIILFSTTEYDIVRSKKYTISLVLLYWMLDISLLVSEWLHVSSYSSITFKLASSTSRIIILYSVYIYILHLHVYTLVVMDMFSISVISIVLGWYFHY